METRINKHRDYRQSLLKEGALLDNSNRENIVDDSSLRTTQTLPMSEVIDKDDMIDNTLLLVTKRLKRKYFWICFSIVSGLILIFILTILGLFLWR